MYAYYSSYYGSLPEYRSVASATYYTAANNLQVSVNLVLHN